MKIVAKKDRKLLLINTGNTQNENKAETIELTVPEEYEDYNKKIVFVTDDGIVWDIIQDNTYKLTKAITKYKQVDFYIWLTKGDIDFRTETRPLRFYYNKDASDEITPEEISGVNTVVNLLEEEIEKVENLNIEAEKVGTVTTLTITKKDGTTESVEINDGQDGQDGYTPQKGVDYFTQQDIEEIEGDIQAIENELQRKVDEGYFDGKDATINGKNSIEIEAGNNITIDNTENGIRINSTGGSSGTSNYNELTNKPKINNVELSGNKSLNNLGIQPAGNYALESDIPDVSDFITRDVNDLTYYYTKTEVDGKVSAVYKYKGTVETYSDLPSTGLTVGDVYNVETDGSNYAWTGSAWDKLGGDVDLSGYQTKITSSNKLSADLISDGTTNKTVTNTEKNTWNNKQNAISDLSTIRSGASAGATAVQPNDLATVATSGSYNDLSNKPTIPSEVTESIVAGWGFTKNTGTYSKPSGGIPKTDLASAVQTSLGKADTALQSHQDISGKEDKTNKVTSISSSSTDTQYPSAKCVYDLIGDVETILTTLTTGSGV